MGYKYDFQVTEVEKNNNVKKIAIVAGMYEESSSIVIYIEGYYEEYIYIWILLVYLEGFNSIFKLQIVCKFSQKIKEQSILITLNLSLL